MYPNPAHQRFQVKFAPHAGPAVATLYNALGQPVRIQTVVGNQATMDTQGLAAGVYMLQVATTAAMLTQRLVVE